MFRFLLALLFLLSTNLAFADEGTADRKLISAREAMEGVHRRALKKYKGYKGKKYKFKYKMKGGKITYRRVIQYCYRGNNERCPMWENVTATDVAVMDHIPFERSQYTTTPFECQSSCYTQIHRNVDPNSQRYGCTTEERGCMDDYVTGAYKPAKHPDSPSVSSLGCGGSTTVGEFDTRLNCCYGGTLCNTAKTTQKLAPAVTFVAVLLAALY